MDEEHTNETFNSAGQGRSSAVKKYFLIGGICFLLVAVSAAFLVYENNRVYKECYVEAGVEVTVQDFLRNPEEEAYFTEESDEIDITIPGEYHVRIRAGYFTHKSTLYITDTIPPQGEPVKVNLELGQECGADAFVTDIWDATKVEVSFGVRPDFAVPGKQNIEVLLTDLGGNQTKIVSELFVSQVVSELTVEAGSEPPTLNDFVLAGEEAEFKTDIGSYRSEERRVGKEC